MLPPHMSTSTFWYRIKKPDAVLLLSFTLAAAGALNSGSAWAQSRRHRSDELTTTSASDYVVDSEHRWGLGLATMTSGMLVPGGNGALTGWIGITPEFGIQPLLTIPSTSPFQFAAGALFKVTVHQMASSGFHVGLGVTMGDVHTTPTVAGGSDHSLLVGLSGLMGFHFVMPGTSNIMVHFDGGPMVNITGGNANFALTPLSAFGGLSVLYLF